MDAEEFAARRRVRFVKADDDLRPIVKRVLSEYADGDSSWADDLIEGASVLWMETFLAEAPNADAERFMPRFQEALAEALAMTERPDGTVDDVQIDRVTKWLGTYTVNEATWRGVSARGGSFKRWIAMDDNAVRETHAVADGQIVRIGGTFDVGGYDLRFPGDPVGPPSIWINCRCVLQAVARTGEANVSPTTFAMADTVVLEDEVDEELPPDELEEGEEEITEIPVHGVLAPEGVPTGDGRMFAVDALTHRELPLPILYQDLTGDGHGGSGRVGRIDEIFREGNEVRFRGAVVLTKEYSSQVVEGIMDGTVRGISVDVDDIELEMSDESMPEDGKMPLTTFSKARVAGVTIVAIPAFQEAFIALGHEFLADLPAEAKESLAACGCDTGGEDDDDNPDVVVGNNVTRIHDLTVLDGPALQAYNSFEDGDAQRAWLEEHHPEAILAAAFAPGTKDGPGWITHPIPTNRIRRYWTSGKGAAKIRWGVPGDFNRCRRQLAKYIANPEWLAGTCANMHKEALGVWPGIKRGDKGLALAASAGTPAPIFNFVAAAVRVFDASLFERVELEDPRVGIMVEGDHVFGYMAQWGVCHIGIQGVCTEAPASKSDYWYYATGVVDTPEGPIHVGQITMDTGHASLKSNAKVAAAHYDNTGAAVADVAVGEDGFGIWFSGVLRPTITDDQLHALRASGRISGDWRTIGGNLEMVAGLVVNVPGLPIPHTMVASADGVQTALVAAGVVPPGSPSAVTASVSISADPEMIAAIARTAVAEYRHAEKREARVTPLRESLRQKRIESLRVKIKE
jgi:hypothetical protein